MLDFGFYNMDCMDGMREFPDKYFELAIVDPPYGIGYDTIAESASGTKSKGAATFKREYHGGGWDSKTPDDEYFDELFRVSKNQIIWGGGIIFNSFRHQKDSFVGIKDAKMTCATISQIVSLHGCQRI